MQPEERKRLQSDSERLFSELSAIIYRVDPIGLNVEENTDEYDREARTILPRSPLEPMTELMKRAFRLLPACVALACASGSDHARRGPPIAPTVRMTRVAPGVSLEVLDWGGRGTLLVFLAGLGSSAHIFDDFGPQFTDGFHVVGITRRGFGASSGSPPPSDLDTLVADITAVLDTLGVRRVVLVGHSIAGEEMTRFAELHGARCAGLIYVDAAYDRSVMDTLAQKQPPTPDPRIRAADTTSFASVRAVYARILGVDEPESEIRATARFDAADRYLGQVTADSLKARVTSGNRVARYDQVHCRALGIYAVPDSLADVVPYYAELDAEGRRQAEALLEFVSAVVAESRGRFARHPQNTVVDVTGANHFVFLQRPAEVARAMRAFLSGQPVAGVSRHR
jgi:pimeloyl-ACP methyl ester carboxylesterase